MPLQDDLTVTLFTSPRPSHPEEWILENVYLSVRNQLPDCRILILADGVKDGPEPPQYKEFKERIEDRGWEMVQFTGWHHQTMMLRECLWSGVIKTPLVLVGEDDWGIQDLPIEWEGIVGALLDPAVPYSYVNIRQADMAPWEEGHFGKTIHTHEITLLETNWLQTPIHVARCAWYKNIVKNFTLPKQLECDEMADGLKANDAIKELTCYIPTVDPAHSGRLYHLDGKNATARYIAGGMFMPGLRRSA
jgi:hypothetical protein